MKTRAVLLALLIAIMPLVSFAQDVDDLKKQIILDQKKLNIMENVPNNFRPGQGQFYQGSNSVSSSLGLI